MALNQLRQAGTGMNLPTFTQPPALTLNFSSYVSSIFGATVASSNAAAVALLDRNPAKILLKLQFELMAFACQFELVRQGQITRVNEITLNPHVVRHQAAVAVEDEYALGADRWNRPQTGVNDQLMEGHAEVY